MTGAIDSRGRTVWILSELYHPELTSTGHYMTAIAERLAADGHRVAVLCGQPTYGARGTRAAQRELRNGVTIHRCRGTTFHKDRILGRIANIVTLSTSTLWTGLRRIRRGDTVIAVTNPPTMPWVGLAASVARRAEFVPVFHDILPIALMVAGHRKPTALSVRFARAMTSLVVRGSGRIVVVGRPLVDELRNYGATDPVVLIPNWSDDQVVHPIEPGESAIRLELGLIDSKVALYAGALGRANDLDTLVEAAVLLSRRPDITFVLCGDGPQRATVERAVVERGLTNVIVTGPYGRERQSDMFGVGDLVVIPMLAGIGRSSMPSRTYNALAAGCPIVAGTEPVSELAMLIDEHAVGVVVEPGRPSELAAAIERMLDDPGRREMAAAGRRAALGPCSAEAALAGWSSFVGTPGPTRERTR